MMFARCSRTAASVSSRRLSKAFLSTEAGPGGSTMMLNFNLPHETIYAGAPVKQVIVPGAAGEYGVTADHVPLVAQLKAGVLQIIHEDGGDPEKFFVPGGFSLTHENSTTVSFDFCCCCCC